MECPSHLNSIGVGEELPCGCGRRSSAVCYLNGDRDLSLGQVVHQRFTPVSGS